MPRKQARRNVTVTLADDLLYRMTAKCRELDVPFTVYVRSLIQADLQDFRPVGQLQP